MQSNLSPGERGGGVNTTKLVFESFKASLLAANHTENALKMRRAVSYKRLSVRLA
jgi:hypothetical protein